MDYKNFYKFLCQKGYIKEIRITDEDANRAVAEFLNENGALPIPDVSISVCPKCGASEVFANNNDEGECAICGHTWQTGC